MYNQLPTAYSPVGRKHSEETKKKIRKAHKGRVLTEEHRKNIGKGRVYLTGKSNPKYGITPSDETRSKMSESAKKRRHHPMSEETKKKISKSHMGISSNIGSKHSEEVKKKMSDARKAWWKKSPKARSLRLHIKNLGKANFNCKRDVVEAFNGK